jgi:hypothetical protein
MSPWVSSTAQQATMLPLPKPRGRSLYGRRQVPTALRPRFIQMARGRSHGQC